MKKIFIFFFILFTKIGFTQEKISEAEKMLVTAKVWGFLKYYHPTVAEGKLNWDNQLFEILPKIEKAETKEEFSNLLENWITDQGELKVNKPNTPKQKNKYFNKNLNLSWIANNNFFSKRLVNKLKFIRENRIQDGHYYIGLQTSNKYAISLEIKNEIKYPDFEWTDRNLRILTLFRYWNYVEYFFPYKYKMDQKWDDSFIEMYPRFNNPNSQLDFHLAMRELVLKLNDTHAWIGTATMYEKFGNKFIPVSVKIIEDKAIITDVINDSLAKKDDLEKGDVITKVKGKTIAQILKEERKYTEGSNRSAQLRESYWHIFNGNIDTVRIEFIRKGITSTKVIHRYLYKDFKVIKKVKEKWKLLEGNIGYVNMGALFEDDVPEIMKQFKNTKAIVFDIRSYPNETHLAIAEYLNPKEKEFAKFIDPDISYPGRYIWRESEKCGKNNSDYYKGKVVILVNENTQSHAEYTAMCLQVAPKSTIIGSQTAGADGGVLRFEIIKGFKTLFTGLGVFYPNGKETQRIGIVPNIEVKPTIKGIQEGRDEVLDRAIKFIQTGK
jgi:C-terminal processing protease CtpA/Prc